jgi:hypothetical protein
LLKLLDICDIIFVPAVTDNLYSVLGHIIEEHHVYLKNMLGSENKLLPKHHFMFHYAMCIRNIGPPVRYWSMRFEARHQIFKQLAKSTHCYENICKSLPKRFQMALALKFLNLTVNKAEIIVGPTRQLTINSLGDTICKVVCRELKMCSQDYIYSADWVSFGHYSFRLNAVTVISICDGTPQSGIIPNTITVDKEVYFVKELLETVHYDEHFHAFAVQQSITTGLTLVKILNLKDHISLQLHVVTYESTNLMGDFVQLLEAYNSLTVTTTKLYRTVGLYHLYDFPEATMSYLKPFPNYFLSKENFDPDYLENGRR